MKLNRMECPGCGADLHPVEGDDFAVCEYCGTRVSVETNTRRVVYRDEARLYELKLREQERQRRDEQQRLDAEKEAALKTLSILTSDDATTALKSVGKLALRFLKNGL